MAARPLPPTHIHSLTPLPPTTALPLLTTFIHWTSSTRPIRDRKHPYNNVPVPPFPASVLTNLRRIEMGLRGEQAPRLYISGSEKRGAEGYEGGNGKRLKQEKVAAAKGRYVKFDDDDGVEGESNGAGKRGGEEEEEETIHNADDVPPPVVAARNDVVDKKLAKKLRKQEDKKARLEKRRKEKVKAEGSGSGSGSGSDEE